ncbi:hypothetical protein ACFQ0D_21275, partial [Micromonospora zhanjiangensis]
SLNSVTRWLRSIARGSSRVLRAKASSWRVSLAPRSAADCAALVRESALAAMRESLEASTVTAEHVATARRRVRPSLDPGQVAWLAAYAEQHATG